MITHPNCKINLGLHVVRRREDGYHDLETIFLPVPLSDELEITPAPQLSFEQDGIPLDSDAEGNLVLKAYRIMQQEFGERIGPVHIRLTKRIPFGAGLGGGSSDAAFALKMLNGLFDMQLSSSKLCRLAARSRTTARKGPGAEKADGDGLFRASHHGAVPGNLSEAGGQATFALNKEGAMHDAKYTDQI